MIGSARVMADSDTEEIKPTNGTITLKFNSPKIKVSFSSDQGGKHSVNPASSSGTSTSQQTFKFNDNTPVWVTITANNLKTVKKTVAEGSLVGASPDYTYPVTVASLDPFRNGDGTISILGQNLFGSGDVSVTDITMTLLKGPYPAGDLPSLLGDSGTDYSLSDGLLAAGSQDVPFGSPFTLPSGDWLRISADYNGAEAVATFSIPDSGSAGVYLAFSSLLLGLWGSRRTNRAASC